VDAVPEENSDPKLVIGPLLRYVGETEATVWVETDSPCEVEVLGRTEPTFTVEGHHYALVRIEGLEPDSFNEYEVGLDGERRWPPAGSDLPPSAIRTLGGEKPIDVCFGSCRVAVPHEEPYTHSKDRHEDGKEYDALYVLAKEMTRIERDKWPEMLFLLGDQVYVDEGSPRTRERIHARRGTETPPGEEVVDFEEYSWLYEESWTDPLIRWLFSTVSVSMQWDDHDMSDDWNISRPWLEEMRRQSWWHGRATAGIMSYWVYQHLGNLSPRALDEDDLYRQVRGNVHATAVLRDFATEVHSTENGARWSYCRDLGNTRVIFMDSRAGRVLKDGERSMVDDEEWEWIVEHATGDFDHLLLATTVPWLLSPGFHHLEAWSERVCDGVWGRPAARAAEKLLRPLGLVRQVVPDAARVAGGGRVR
jgi:phosphodiesterase/alkaline phosphatase D-like protein